MGWPGDGLTFKMTDAIHRVLRSRPTAACIPQEICARCLPLPHFILAAMTTVDNIIMSFARSELGSVAERIAQWEDRVKQFRAACAQVAWDDPAAFMLQHDGYRMPLADLIAPTIGGGQCKGSYSNLVEQFEGTPDGYLSYFTLLVGVISSLL